MVLTVAEVGKLIKEQKKRTETEVVISLKTGIHAKELASILAGIQDIRRADMEKIASALGRTPEYFF